MQPLIKPNHYFLSINDQIRTISKPLLTHFGISSFVYSIIFADGSDLKLGTNPDWIEFFYNQHLYQLSQLENRPSFYTDGFVLWSQLPEHQILLKYARDNFNIDHGVTYVKASSDKTELFFFGTTRDNSDIVHYYINNLDLLKKFSQYFVTTAQPIINQANKHRIFIPNKFESMIVTPQGNLDIDYKNDFLQSIQIQPYQIDTTYKGINITAREWEVCGKLIQGKTAKDIAVELFLSSRTVETHLANIKEKLQCHTKSELIKKLHHFNLGSL